VTLSTHDLLYYERRRRNAERIQKALQDRGHRVTAEEQRTGADLLLFHEMDLRKKVSDLADELRLTSAQCDDLFEQEGLTP
jgi:hypothetical protein